MEKRLYSLIATSVFGLESVVKKECEDLGFNNIRISNGRVEFEGGQRDIARANLWLRSSERVFIKLAEFKALTYDDLYDNCKAVNWEDYLSRDGKFIVNAKSVKSKLMSPSDNQSICKKAIIDRLSERYNLLWFPENEERYRIDVSINKDLVTISLDTSGEGLHKRGYRLEQNKAPMKETLAAALVQLSSWKADRPLVDLFCGSGTILIEAALIGRNIAPGIQRDFDFIHWKYFDESVFREEKARAYGEMKDVALDIIGFDIDRKSVEMARSNASNAGFDDIKFITKDMKDVGLLNNFGVVISNPPYGERLGDEKSLKIIYENLSKHIKGLTTWSFYLITADRSLESQIGRLADKKRKLYNGRIQVDYYYFLGPNPDLLR